MDTDGGGWMHCGTINDSNESINNAAHIWGNPLNPAQDTGIWQDNTTYGSLSLNSDYKSQLIIYCQKKNKNHWIKIPIGCLNLN